MTQQLHTASFIQMLLIALITVAPAFGQGGRGGRGMMGDAAHAADMQLFHELFDHRTEIDRQVIVRVCGQAVTGACGGGQRISQEWYVGDDEEPSRSAALVMIVSASTDADIAKEALRSGASAFVNKAAAVDKLVPAVQRAMATRSRPVHEARQWES